MVIMQVQEDVEPATRAAVCVLVARAIATSAKTVGINQAVVVHPATPNAEPAGIARQPACCAPTAITFRAPTAFPALQTV
jgi:hypothetical protein